MELAKTTAIIFLAIFLSALTSHGQHIDQQFLPQISKRPELRSVAAQADGKIIAAGDVVLVDDKPVSRFIRLNTDGTLDESFMPPVSVTGSGVVNSIVVDKKQRIIVGGTLGNETHAVRLLPDGTLDASFSLSPAIENVIKIDTFPGNRYIILSFSYPRRLFVVNEDGSIDPSFVATGPDAVGIYGSDFSVLPDGRVVVVGSFTNFNDEPHNHVVRLNADGTVDHSFDIGDGPQGAITMNSVKVQSDGKILIAGSFNGFNNANAVNIVRLHPDGAVDESFIMPGPAANFFTSGIRAMTLSDDSIYLTGYKIDTAIPEYHYAVWKLDPDGALDHAFSAPFFDLSLSSSVSAPRLLSTNAGIYLTGAFLTTGMTRKHGIARLDRTTGAIDVEFDPLLRGAAQIKTVHADANGKVLIGGRFDFVGGALVNNFARLNPDGSLDEGFALNVASNDNDLVNRIEIDAGGKILVAGAQWTPHGTIPGYLARLNDDGTIDGTFTASVGSTIQALQLLPDGDMVIGGSFKTVSGQSCNGIAVLNNDGTLRASFNSPFPNAHRILALGSLGNNKFLVGGHDTSTGAGVLYKMDRDGNIEDDFDHVDFHNRSVMNIYVLPDGGFLTSGTFVSSFSDTAPNQVYQFNSQGELVDNTSIAVYAGGHRIEDMLPLADNYIMLAGSFLTVNSVPSSNLTMVKLNGQMTTRYSFEISGAPYALHQFGESTIFVAGVFSYMNGIRAFSLVKVDMETPATPTYLTHTVNKADGEISVSWTDHAFNETGFQIMREVDGVTTIIDTVDADVQAYVDLSAEPMKMYRYRVRAISDDELSLSSDVTEVSTNDWIPPVRPENIAYDIDRTFGSVQLSWTDVSDNEQGFEIERALGDQAFSLIMSTEPNVTTMQEALFFGSRIRYRIRAYNRFGKSDYAGAVELPIILDVLEPSTVSASVYPNPAARVLHISHQTQRPVKVTLLDMTGKVFLDQQFDDELITLDLTDVPASVYVVNVQTATGFKVFKLHKQ